MGHFPAEACAPIPVLSDFWIDSASVSLSQRMGWNDAVKMNFSGLMEKEKEKRKRKTT